MFKSIYRIFSSGKKSHYATIDQLRYLSQSALIEEAKAPNTIRTILTIFSSLIVLLTIWAGFTEVAEMAVTEGEIVPSSYVQSIQHLEGGIISEIKVVEGQLVEKGQTLAILDGTSLKLDLSSLKTKELDLEYQAHKFKSFINQTSPNFADISDTADAALEEQQLNAYKSMVAAKISEQNIINEQITEKKASLESLTKKKETLSQNLKLIEEERRLKQELFKRGNLSKFKFLEIEKQYNETQGSLREVDADLLAAENAIDEYEHRLDSLNKKSIDNAYQALSQVEIQLAEVRDEIRKLESQIGRLNVRSPAYGFVKGLKIKTIGGVIEPGKVLMEIVPMEDQLFIESKIQPKDVGHVVPGQRVKIKVSAFDYSRYGSIEGKLEYVSATTFTDTDGTKYYMGRISLKQNYVGTDPKNNVLIPGMIVEADIVTGYKSILRYLLKPWNTARTNAFTER